MYIERQLLITEQPSENQRVYPRYLWDELFQEMKDQRLLGELRHPEQTPADILLSNIVYCYFLLLQDASHIVTNPNVDEDRIYADIKFLKIPKGESAKKIVEELGIDKFKLELNYKENNKGGIDVVSADLVMK